jgi:protein gp37
MRGIHKNPRHTFMFLTKRPIRMREILSPPSSFMVEGKPLPNLWLGVTVCAPDELWKIGELLQTPAAKYFVSFEPLLAHVDPTVIDWTAYMGSTATKNALTGEVHIPGNCGESSQTIQGKKLDWCIVGGETGPGARPMHPDWVRSLRDQCKEAGTPLFFKGWGDFMPVTPDEVPAAWKDCAGFHVACAYGYHEPLHALWYCRAPKPCAGIEHPPGAKCPLVHMRRVGKRRAGRLLDGREWNEVPS